MFKFNNSCDRVDYGKILRPPNGYVLDKAIGTTYSLDLETLTAISISLGMDLDTDSDLKANPMVLLRSLLKISDKILVFCEDGQIKAPGKPNKLSILLEKVVKTVALPKKDDFFPAFHPKMWLLSFVNENDEDDKKYRFVILSRNLTFDRSWDVCLSMDSSKKIRQKKTKPIIEFLTYLRQYAENKRDFIDNFTNELDNVSFELSSKQFKDSAFEILPLFTDKGKRYHNMNEDMLFTDSFHGLVVISPFLTKSVIENLNEKSKGLKECKRTLITRRSELSKLEVKDVNNFNIYVLKDEIVDGEDAISEQDVEDKSRQDIHAKVYLKRKNSDVDLYIGSMNASYTAINSNVEIMVKLSTKNRYLNECTFLNDLGFNLDVKNPFEQINLSEVEPELEENTNDNLEKILKEFCRVKRSAKVEKLLNERYRIVVSFENDINHNIKISPFNSNQQKVLSKQVVFDDLDVLDISEFYKVEITDGYENSITRLIMIQTEGLPENRKEKLIKSIIPDKKSFENFINLYLEDDPLVSFIERQNLKKSETMNKNQSFMTAIYEKMLKTSVYDPEKIKEINYILKILSTEDIVPDEFKKLYSSFCETLKFK